MVNLTVTNYSVPRKEALLSRTLGLSGVIHIIEGKVCRALQILRLFLLKSFLVILGEDFEIVVYRATPAGISAAVTAKRLGSTVVIIDDSRRVGGMMTHGLGASDVCLTRVIGGFAKEFYQRIGRAYGKSISYLFEPKVALSVFKEYLRGIPVVKSDIESVYITNGEIRYITLESGVRIAGKMYIDASYEGDLAYLSGVTMRTGRESVSEYGESLAGFRWSFREGQVNVPIKARDSSGRLRFGVKPFSSVRTGSSHDGIMAYNVRLCLTRDKRNKRSFPKPANYNRRLYDLYALYIRSKPVRDVSEILNLQAIPRNKFDLNNRGPFSTNVVGENWDYPNSDRATRRQIKEFHKTFVIGLLYYLSNDMMVPVRLRSQIKQYGLCKDEFVETDNIPDMIYVRAARRMVSDYVLRQADIQRRRSQRDSVGKGSCPIESHIVQRIETQDGTVRTEGFVREYQYGAYDIPYRSIVPRRSEVKNLFVPVALSASHIAYSAVRMEPTFMILGQSSAAAAFLAIRERTAVQDVPYRELKDLLLRLGQRL